MADDPASLIDQLRALAPWAGPDQIRAAVRRAVRVARAANEPLTVDTVARYARAALNVPETTPAVACDTCGSWIDLEDFAPLPAPSSPRRAMCPGCGSVMTLGGT